jgi:hypothetical protein
MNYQDWALKISGVNPNFNSAVFPEISLPNDPNDYNYNLGYLNDPNGDLAANGHLSDIGKLPNHPTFSNESAYAVGRNDAGRWVEPLSGDNWRYHNASHGLLYAPESSAYSPATQGSMAIQKIYNPVNGISSKEIGRRF